MGKRNITDMGVERGFDHDPSQGGGAYNSIDWMPSRFKLDPGSESDVILLEDQPPIKLLEHQLTIGNVYGNSFVCPQMFNDRCFLCEEVQVENYEGTEIIDETPYWVWCFTVLNETGVEDGDGDPQRNIKQVVPAKRGAKKHIERKISDAKEEVGKWPVYYQFNVNRDSTQNYRVGNEWELEGRASKKKLKKLKNDGVDLEPFDWDEIAVVYDYDEMKEMYQNKENSSKTSDEIIEDTEVDEEVSSNGSEEEEEDDELSEDDGFFDDLEDEEDEASSSDSEEDEDLVNY